MAMVRFEDVATRVNTREDRFNTALTYYVGGDHIETGELKVAGRGVIKEADLGPMFYFGFKPGDILFVTRNPHLRKCAMVDFPGICSEKTLVIATKDENVLSQKYLATVMQSDDFWEFMEENKSGSVNYFVNWSTLADYEFDLPPIERQRKLADLLWAANDLKEAYKKAIFATDEMLKAKFREMFGRDIKHPRHRCVKVSEIAKVTVGVVIQPTRFYTEDWKQGVKAFRSMNVGPGYIKDRDWVYFSREAHLANRKTTVHAGDVLVVRSGAPGTSCVVPECFDNTNVVDLIIAHPDKKQILPEYLCAFGNSEMGQAQVLSASGGSALKHFNVGSYSQLSLPLPPLSLQCEFVAIAEEAEAAKAALNQSISDLEQVMKGLINE